MSLYDLTRDAGSRAEDEVFSIIKKYTKHSHKNVRVDTRYTKSGNTEIDVLAAIADVLLVVEVKNVRRISGEVSSNFWRMEGLDAGQSYSTLNTFTQNRIHVRSLKDAWYEKVGEYPTCISVVVVPNCCVIDCDEVANSGVLTVREFSEQLSELVRNVSCTTIPKYGYTLDYFVDSGCGHIRRDWLYHGKV